MFSSCLSHQTAYWPGFRAGYRLGFSCIIIAAEKSGSTKMERRVARAVCQVQLAWDANGSSFEK
jgi:hypothetical protein